MSPPIKSYFLCSPALDQASAIAQFIRKHKPSIEIVGITMPGELPLNRPILFDKLRHVNSLSDREVNAALIPTGGISTKYYLETYGDVRLGEITLTKAALRVFNKPWFLDHAQNLGIPVPETWQSLDKVPAYPIFYKPRYEAGGGTRGVALSPNDIPSTELDELIFQELIVSDGTYGVGLLADQGKLLTTHTHFESESIPKTGGSAVIIQRFNDARLVEYTRRLIESLDYSGWGLAEFKFCPKRNDYVLMEINAKFWASCELAFLNEPMFLKLLLDIDSYNKSVVRMVFIERALQRGILFCLKNMPLFVSGSTLRLYPGWARRLLAGILPVWMRRSLKFVQGTRPKDGIDMRLR